MNDIVCCAVVLFATTLGALAGIGGGVIIKPVFDAIGEYSAAEISVISSCAVFAMSLLSTVIGAKQLRRAKNILPVMSAIAAGSAAGGYLGEFIFSRAVSGNSPVKTVQNVILLILIVFVVIYMRKQEKKTFDCKSPFVGLLAGLLLGACAAFLGIGGGPINVAVITLIFGFEIKTAVVCSIMTILFSQGTKLITIAVRDISSFEIKILPFAVAAGLCGALIGRMLNKKAGAKAVNNCFIAVQVLTAALCIFNIIKYSV